MIPFLFASAFCFALKCLTSSMDRLHQWPNSSVFCNAVDQFFIDTSPCYVDGGKYQPGEKYATKDCRALCVCNTNFASCTPLCQEKKQLSCPAGFTPSSIRQPAATGSNCACDTPTCLEGIVQYILYMLSAGADKWNT